MIIINQMLKLKAMTYLISSFLLVCCIAISNGYAAQVVYDEDGMLSIDYQDGGVIDFK
ncbi:hypothetical protein ACUNIY_12700 [Serratia sp. IR-2025]|uniref:hypothetical protein n=1 Tax=Serratia marcescens TaxID=615 RepID=UPI003879D4EE